MGGEGEERQAHLERVAVPAAAGVLVGVVDDLGADENSLCVPRHCKRDSVVVEALPVPARICLELGPRSLLVLVAGAERRLRQEGQAHPVVEHAVEHAVRLLTLRREAMRPVRHRLTFLQVQHYRFAQSLEQRCKPV